MATKQLRHFRLSDRTMSLMDVLIANPPRKLADGPYGAVSSRTDLIERLVWEASRDLPDSLVATSSKEAKPRPAKLAKRQPRKKA